MTCFYYLFKLPVLQSKHMLNCRSVTKGIHSVWQHKKLSHEPEKALLQWEIGWRLNVKWSYTFSLNRAVKERFEIEHDSPSRLSAECYRQKGSRSETNGLLIESIWSEPQCRDHGEPFVLLLLHTRGLHAMSWPCENLISICALSSADCQPPCQNRGSCSRPHTCVCRSGFQGPRCEEVAPEQVYIRDGGSLRRIQPGTNPFQKDQPRRRPSDRQDTDTNKVQTQQPVTTKQPVHTV